MHNLLQLLRCIESPVPCRTPGQSDTQTQHNTSLTPKQLDTFPIHIHVPSMHRQYFCISKANTCLCFVYELNTEIKVG